MKNDVNAGAVKQPNRLSVRSTVIASAVLTLCAVVVLPYSSIARDRHDQDEMSVPTTNQALDIADAQTARFKADLRLTPDQEKNWGTVQTALHDMAQRRVDRSLKLHERRTAATTETQRPDAKDGKTQDSKVPGNQDWSTIDEMRMQADTLSAHADDLRKIADATGPLYDSLDSSQRRRFGSFFSHFFHEERDDDWHR
jgi:LTXXQ motif family protein